MAFLIEHYKKGLFGFFALCMLFSMTFSGILGSRLPSRRVKDQSFTIGSAQKFAFSRKQIDAMKTYISHDMGYGFNDVLNKQNIFGDGFFIQLLSSRFGRKILENHFALIKDDFAKAVAKHKNDVMYRHTSLKFSLLEELKRYAPTLHKKYLTCKNHTGDVDVALLNTYIDLMQEQTLFRPKDMKMLTKLFCRDRKLSFDASIDKRNMALFHAKNFSDIFGDSAMELMAEATLYLSTIAKHNGYSTAAEEASGIIQRRAHDLINDVFKRVEEKEERDKIYTSFAGSLGLEKKWLVDASSAIITLQKMYKDLDAKVIVDERTLQTLFKDIVEQAEVAMVHDTALLDVNSVKDALCLDIYLSAIGDKKGFLEVPKKAHSKEYIAKNTKDLFVEKKVFKVASVSIDELKNTITNRAVLDFQVSDRGWQQIAEKFRFDAKDSKERYSFIQGLNDSKKADIEDFCRKCLVELDKKSIEKALQNKQMTKTVHMLGNLSINSMFDKNFDDQKFFSELESTEDQFIPFYTQDNQIFYKAAMLEKSDGKKFLCCADAIKQGYLEGMLEKQLVAMNKGQEIETGITREKLMHRLIMRMDPVQAEKIQALEKEGKSYFGHQEKRIKAYLENELENTSEGLLAQFAVYDGVEVVSRFNNNSEMAKKELFDLKVGDKSPINYLRDGKPYYAEMKEKRIDKEKLTKVKRKVASELQKEARDEFEEQMIEQKFSKKWYSEERFTPAKEGL